jgi:hypothetical protein
MNMLAFFISISLFSFASLINVVLAQGFTHSCSFYSWDGVSKFKYSCTRYNGEFIEGLADLNLCIKNQNGQLTGDAR